MRLATCRAAALVVAGLLATAGCAREVEPDAYGNVEATEVIVSSESSGQLVTFTVSEGQKVAAGAVVGTVDAAPLAREREQMAAQRAASASRVMQATRQIEALEKQTEVLVAQRKALEAQREIAQRAFERTRRLIAEQAATAQQLDQAERDYRVLGEQIEQSAKQIEQNLKQIEAARAELQAVRQEVASAAARVAQIEERIHKSQITNPIAGTVLATYARAGEVVQAGQPVYKIANLESMEVRAYVAETELARVRIGQPAQVSVDVGKDQRRSISGTVTWVSAEAEFTPTPIQTRDERADLVYAIKIRVPNEGGILKIGMPVDVQFPAATTSP